MRRCAVVLALLSAMSFCGTAVAAGPQAGVARVGAAPGGQRLELVFPLRVDGSGLQQWATSVNTPGSPNYGDYESIAQLARRFGASAAVESASSITCGPRERQASEWTRPACSSPPR